MNRLRQILFLLLGTIPAVLVFSLLSLTNKVHGPNTITMKSKATLLSLFLLFSMMLQAQQNETTYITDTDFEQVLIDLGYDDVIDHSVLTSKIVGVTSLDVSEQNISDLTGIEDFTSLEEFNCSYNQLTRLDLSNNLALIELECFYNELTSLNVTQNAALTILDCAINQLTSLNVTHNTALTHLSCYENQLTKLNVSQNRALKNLFCFDNQLTSLEIGAKTLVWLKCFRNELTSLDVTSDSALTMLECGENQLTSIDVTQNGALTSFGCSNNQLSSIDVTRNRKLLYFGCATNQLTSLDITKNTALIYIDCRGNKLTNLDVTKNTDLVELLVSDNELVSIDVKQNTSLTDIYADNNQLTRIDVTQNKAMTYFDCSVNQLTCLDVSQNKAITYFNCSVNQLTCLDARNGNNSILRNIRAEDNPSLTCIQVDNASNANADLPPYTYWDKDASATYSDNCACTYSTSFPQGWNWFSVNVLKDDMSLENLFTCSADGDYIKNQILSATYYDVGGWFGSLADAGLELGSSYKIKTTNPCVAKYLGSPVDLLSTPIDIVPGWNWISYLPQCTLPIDEAMSTLTLETDDYIKNQTASTTYYEGFGWYGSLEELKPGEGYMLKKTTADVLIYPECPPASSGARKTASADKVWVGTSLNPNQFEYNGTVTAKVFLDGVLTGGEKDLILAYVDDQLRGMSKGLYFEPTGVFTFPMMVYSNMAEGETIRFKYYVADSDQLFSCDETLVFTADMIVANAYESFELNVNSTVGLNDQSSIHGPSLEVYPNPFTDQLQIEYKLVERSKVRVAVYDMLSKVVKILEEQILGPGTYNTEWNAEEYAEGTYIIQMTIQNSSIRQKVFLVK